MTIRLTEAELEEQFQEADEEELQFDPTDKLDTTFKFGGRFAQGWTREIDLREGVHLVISQIQNKEHVIIDYPKDGLTCRNILCYFTLSGYGQGIIASKSNEILYSYVAGKYYLRSNGIEPPFIDKYGLKPWLTVVIEIYPKILCSFAASTEGELPKNLQHLVKPASQMLYVRSGDIQPIMATVLQQILNCPYQGIVKRAYLESKAIELMALVLDHEAAIQRGETKSSLLRPDQLERIHYAKEILLRDLNNPPSLEELAHQAGLNDFLLKRGFHQAFGTTVFGELQAYRLEKAKRLLAEQDISVAKVASLVGYASRSSFSRSFKQRFGVTPKQHQKKCW